MGCHFLLQGIFPTQASNLCLLHLLNLQADSLPLVPPYKHVLDDKFLFPVCPSFSQAHHFHCSFYRHLLLLLSFDENRDDGICIKGSPWWLSRKKGTVFPCLAQGNAHQVWVTGFAAVSCECYLITIFTLLLFAHLFPICVSCPLRISTMCPSKVSASLISSGREHPDSYTLRSCPERESPSLGGSRIAGTQCGGESHWQIPDLLTVSKLHGPAPGTTRFKMFNF